MVKYESLNQLCISLHIYRIKLFFSNFRSIAALTTRISCNLKVWMNSLFIYSQSKYFLFQTSGPSLPMPLFYHKMVRLGKGQAILGGKSYDDYQDEIYSMTCSNRDCTILLLDRELSVPKYDFVAIPIPDTISGCITDGRNIFQKTPPKYVYVQANICFTPQI